MTVDLQHDLNFNCVAERRRSPFALRRCVVREPAEHPAPAATQQSATTRRPALSKSQVTVARGTSTLSPKAVNRFD